MFKKLAVLLICVPLLLLSGGCKNGVQQQDQNQEGEEMQSQQQEQQQDGEQVMEQEQEQEQVQDQEQMGEDPNMEQEQEMQQEQINQPDEAGEAESTDEQGEQAADSPEASLAKCLTANGAKLYTAEWCGHCKNQKEAFGDGLQYLDNTECAAMDGWSVACKDAGIEGVPTWIFADGTKKSGNTPLPTLAELGGCEYNPVT